jgi:hypothetical protein
MKKRPDLRVTREGHPARRLSLARQVRDQLAKDIATRLDALAQCAAQWRASAAAYFGVLPAPDAIPVVDVAQSRRTFVLGFAGACTLSFELLIGSYLAITLLTLRTWVAATLGVFVALVVAAIVAAAHEGAAAMSADDPKGSQRFLSGISLVAGLLCLSAIGTWYLLRLVFFSELVALIALSVLSLTLPTLGAAYTLSAKIEGVPNRHARRFQRLQAARDDDKQDIAELDTTIAQLEKSLAGPTVSAPPSASGANGSAPRSSTFRKESHHDDDPQ